jgi:hypothetical protein
MNTPIYGIGYEPIGDLADFVDPLGLRKIPGKINKRIDRFVDEKAGRAARLAEQRVEAGVRRAINESGKSAVTFVAGGLLVGAIVGAVYFYQRRAGHRR